MKKTLFLSAILGAALCSSAFATETQEYPRYEKTSGLIDLSSYTDTDTVILAVTQPSGPGAYFDSKSLTIKGNYIIESLVFNNGYSANYTYTFTGSISGTGPFTRGSGQTNNKFLFKGDVSGYTGAISFSSAGDANVNNANQLIFDATAFTDGMTVNASSITMSNNAQLKTVGNVTFSNTIKTNTSLTVGAGTTTLGSTAILDMVSPAALATGATLALSDGTTLKMDNMQNAFEVADPTESGLTQSYYRYTIASGDGSVTRTGAQHIKLSNADQSVTWAADSKSFMYDSKSVYHVASGDTKTLSELSEAAAGVDSIVVSGTLQADSTTSSTPLALHGGTLVSTAESHAFSGAVRMESASTIEDTALSGTVDVKVGVLTIKGAVSHTRTFDMSGQGNVYTGNMLIKNGATFTSSSDLWVSNNSHNRTTFTLEQEGQFIKDGYTLTGRAGNGTLAAGGTAALNMNAANTLTNLNVEYSGNAATTSAQLAGTTTLKNTGANLLSFNGSIASGAVLEGVLGADGVTSNVKYKTGYGANQGTLKNVNIENLDAGANNGSIILDGVYGSIKNGGTQRNIKLTGNGLHLTVGANNGSYTIATLTGTGNLEKKFTDAATITLQNATAWTGTFVNTSKTGSVVFNGNSTASVEGGNVTLKGTSYTGNHISDATVTLTNEEAITISSKLENVTLDGTGKTVTLSGTISGKSAITNATLSGKIENATITVAENGHLNIGASLTDATIVGNATLVGGSRLSMTGTVTLGNMTNDLTWGGNNYALVGGSALVIAGDVNLTQKSDGSTNTYSNVGLTKGNTITVQNGGSLTAGSLMNTETSDNNATVIVEKGATLTAARLLSPDFTNNGTATITGSTALKEGYTGNGIINLTNSGTLTFGNGNTSVTSLTLNSGSITLGSAAEGEHDFDLTTSGLKVNGNANINANLVMNSGTLTFADNAVLTMGCDVTIGNDVTVVLTDTMVESIMAGNYVEIIAGVDKAYLSESLTFSGSGDLSGYVAEHEAVYSLKQVGDKIYITPEPATATLSLLALAALAARRRRH